MAWFDQSLPQHLIVMAHKLTDMSERLLTIARDGGHVFASDQTADELGMLEYGWSYGLPPNTNRYRASGQVGRMLDRLGEVRDEWMEDEHMRRLNGAGISMPPKRATRSGKRSTATRRMLTRRSGFGWACKRRWHYDRSPHPPRRGRADREASRRPRPDLARRRDRAGGWQHAVEANEEIGEPT